MDDNLKENQVDPKNDQSGNLAEIATISPDLPGEDHLAAALGQPPPEGCHDSSREEVRVLVIDDHPIVRDGLRFSLSKLPGFAVCGEAESVEKALQISKEIQPEMVVLDLVFGGRDGMEGVAQMRQALPQALILVFSMNPEELFAERALNAGANGYLMKTDGFKALHHAMETMREGEAYLSDRMRQRLSSSKNTARPAVGDLSLLTEREMQIFWRIGEGKTSGSIATELGLSVKTVATHRENMKAKLCLESGPDLTRRAITWVLAQGNAR